MPPTPQTVEKTQPTINTGSNAVAPLAQKIIDKKLEEAAGSNAVAPLAKEIINEKLEEANHITELDSSLGTIKEEIEHKSLSKHIETIPENMTIAQAVEQFFAEQQNNTLDQLEKNDKNEVGLLATDLAVYQCIVSVIDHIMTQILAKNPSISQADMQKTLSTIMSQISDISMLQHTIANPPSINNIAITGPISLDADETTVLKLLSSQTPLSPLSQDYNTGHGTDLSHYGQVLSLVNQGMHTKIEEHYSTIAQIGQIGDEITTTATGVSATVSEKAGQAWERTKGNPTKAIGGAVALGGVAVYGLYKFVKWRNSDDAPTTIVEDSENNTDSQKYNQHMKDGHALYKQGKYAQAKEQFEAASLLSVSNNEAKKRIKECESKTGTTGLWKSKLGTFLKWAGIGIGTLIGGTWLYQLYQKWIGETSDNPGTGAGINNESSVGDSYDEYTKKPENKEKSTKYTNIGTQINNFYDDLYQFPGQTNQAYTEYNLGTSKDLDPGALLRSIDNSFETIESFKSGGGILLLLLESDASKLAKTMANMLGTSAGWIVKTLLSYVNTNVGATAGEWTEQKIISALSGANAVGDIHKVVHKYLKIMSSCNYAENVYIKEKITQGLSSGRLRQKNEQLTYETITIPDQPEARQKLIESIASNPENYELGTINVSTYKTEFVNQKLVDIDISLFDSQKIYAHNPQLKNIKDTYDTQRQKSHIQIDQNKDQELEKLKTDCEKQLKGGRIQWIKNNIPPAYLIELCGGSTDDDHILALIQDKGGFDSQIQQFQQTFEDMKKESDITKIKAKVDQYYMTLKEMYTISDGINESVDENGNLILTASTVIHGFGGAMMMCFQATKDTLTGKGGIIKGVAGVYGLAAGLSILPVPISSWSRKLLVKSYKVVSFVGSKLYTHIAKPGGIAGWNKMTGLLKKGLDQALVKASFLPSWMKSGAITRLQQAQQGMPVLQQAGEQIASSGSVSARTVQGLQGFFNNPAIKGILKYSPAIAELGCGLYEARGQNKEAQELKKINQMQADNKKDEKYFDLSVSAVTATLMTIGIANGRNPVGWGMIALGVGTQGIKAIGDLYYNTKDEFYVNKQQYQQMNIGKLKQSIVEHLYDQDGSKHIARETKFVQMFNYLGTNFDKNKLVNTGIDQAIPVLVQADEYGLTGVSAEKLGNSNNLITQKIQYRIDYINETLGHSQGKDIKTVLKAYLDQGHGLTGLEKLLSDSRIFAQMKMDEEYQNNVAKTQNHNTIAGYEAYLESSLHESCEKRDHMEYLWTTQRDTLSKLIVHSPSYMQELLQIKPEGYAKKYQNIQYIQKYRSYKTLGRAPEQYPDPAIAVQQDDTHLPAQLDLLVDVIDQAPQDLAPVTIDHDQLVSDSSLASVLSVEDIEKKLGLSDKPGQNILYQIARRYLGYTGGNTLHELQNFYPESKKEEQGFYYTEGKRYLNQKGSIKGFIGRFSIVGGIVSEIGETFGVDTELGNNTGLNQGFIDALNQGLLTLNDIIQTRNNNINTERLEQFRKIVSEEAQYTDEKVKTQIKNKIIDYIKKHSNDTCTYIQLPIELVIQGIKAGYGNVGGLVYARDGSKIIAQGNTRVQNKVSNHIVSASDIVYLS